MNKSDLITINANIYENKISFKKINIIEKSHTIRIFRLQREILRIIYISNNFAIYMICMWNIFTAESTFRNTLITDTSHSFDVLQPLQRNYAVIAL